MLTLKGSPVAILLWVVLALSSTADALWSTQHFHQHIMKRSSAILATNNQIGSPIVSNLALKSLLNLSNGGSRIDWTKLESFLQEKMALNYKDWSLTCSWADQLAEIIGEPSQTDFQTIFERVLVDGNWYNAAKYAKSVNNERGENKKPWIVLVTGLNGIRKTTSIYQPWFQKVLKESLGDSYQQDISYLPTGDNSFFRQLDYMIATVANEEFRELYAQSSTLSTNDYSSKKDDIFKRYRTFAEILGVHLLRSAQRNHMNALVETSGRDIAMFDYIDTLFSGISYRKLVLHFTIDDIKHAEASVDVRMAGEMKLGGEVSAQGGDARAVVGVNAGGPCKSSV